MIEIRSGRLEPAQGTGPRTDADTFYFDRQVEKCWVALTGYKLGYRDDDHHVRTISVDLSAGLQETESGSGVVVEGTLLLDDKNGDDTFAGWADYLLFVEVGRRLVDGGETPEPEPVTETGPVQKG
jgi:hypothetical protein